MIIIHWLSIVLSLPLVALLVWFFYRFFGISRVRPAIGRNLKEKILFVLFTAAGLFFWACAESVAIVLPTACPRVRGILIVALIVFLALCAPALFSAVKMIEKWKKQL